MTRQSDSDPLYDVMTAMEAAELWGLSRNAIPDAIKRGSLRARKSGHIWIITVADFVAYQRGRYWPEKIPTDLLPVVKAAAERYRRE